MFAMLSSSSPPMRSLATPPLITTDQLPRLFPPKHLMPPPPSVPQHRLPRSSHKYSHSPPPHILASLQFPQHTPLHQHRSPISSNAPWQTDRWADGCGRICWWQKDEQNPVRSPTKKKGPRP